MNTTNCVLVLALAFTAGVQAQSSAPSCCPQTPSKEKQLALWHKLEDRIAEVDRRLDGTMGVAIRDLTDGKTLLLHGDDIFAQASSIKITVLAELYMQEQRGRRGERGVARLLDP